MTGNYAFSNYAFLSHYTVTGSIVNAALKHFSAKAAQSLRFLCVTHVFYIILNCLWISLEPMLQHISRMLMCIEKETSFSWYHFYMMQSLLLGRDSFPQSAKQLFKEEISFQIHEAGISESTFISVPCQFKASCMSEKRRSWSVWPCLI